MTAVGWASTQPTRLRRIWTILSEPLTFSEQPSRLGSQAACLPIAANETSSPNSAQSPTICSCVYSIWLLVAPKTAGDTKHFSNFAGSLVAGIPSSWALLNFGLLSTSKIHTKPSPCHSKSLKTPLSLYDSNSTASLRGFRIDSLQMCFIQIGSTSSFASFWATLIGGKVSWQRPTKPQSRY